MPFHNIWVYPIWAHFTLMKSEICLCLDSYSRTESTQSYFWVLSESHWYIWWLRYAEKEEDKTGEKSKKRPNDSSTSKIFFLGQFYSYTHTLYFCIFLLSIFQSLIKVCFNCIGFLKIFLERISECVPDFLKLND